MSPYDSSSTDAKWQKIWEDAKAYEVDLKKVKNPYYSLIMFPYPSGDKLHVGHWYNFAPADSYARFIRMQGKDVLTPIGFDAFGLPAENYAIKTGIHPDDSITENVKTMITQLKRMGCMYDWSKMVNTSKPEYYRWTQWLFLQMFKHDLAYKKEANVNWCESCQTVLANEQAQDGTCERCGTKVIQKPMNQWYWKITEYADQLLEGLEDLDWPEKTKTMQKNWIGKKEGIELTYEIEGSRRGTLALELDNEIASCNRIVSCSQQFKSQDENDSPHGSRRFKPSATGSTKHGSRRFKPPAMGYTKGRIYSPRTVHLVFTPKKRSTIFQGKGNSVAILRFLNDVAKRHEIVIHDACAMPDHVHLLITFERNRDLMKDITKKLKGASARLFLNRIDATYEGLWGEGAHHENIDSTEQFNSVLSYIQNNPLKSNIDSDGRILSNLPLTITCFTTRPDTNFGATFVVLAPEHEFTQRVAKENNEVKKYTEKSMNKTDLDRQEEGRKKTGVFTGYYAINNLNGRKIPIWVSDFVLGGFGTGAVVGVPGHDMRDFEFAKQFDIPIIRVVIGSDGDKSEIKKPEQVQEEHGTMINSDFLDGMEIMKAKDVIMDHIEKNGWGKRVTSYRLRDWSISRQRYWGAPIPIVYDPEGNPHPIPENYLPWELPKDVEFKPTGTSPLFQSKELKERTEKIFGKGWTPEVDTMDTFVCSSFYQFMYLSTEGYGMKKLIAKSSQLKASKGKRKDDYCFIEPDIEEKWMPVDMYIGGPEHACMHLIYARFVTKALRDFGFVKCDEPFKKLVHQGLITNNGAKMSKSKGNVVSPDEFVEKYGSDVFRMYLMFMGPFTDGGDWSDTGIKGLDRFAQRMWTVLNKRIDQCSSEVEAKVHATIKKCTEEISALRFNTAIASLMELLNLLDKQGGISQINAETVTKLLSPLAPHLSQEIWENIGGKEFVINQSWPKYNPDFLKKDTITIAIQINGKIRAEIDLPADASAEDAIAQAKSDERVKKYLAGNQPKKEIYVKGKLVSLVV